MAFQAIMAAHTIHQLLPCHTPPATLAQPSTATHHTQQLTAQAQPTHTHTVHTTPMEPATTMAAILDIRILDTQILDTPTLDIQAMDNIIKRQTIMDLKFYFNGPICT